MTYNAVYLEDFAPQNNLPINDWSPIMAAAIASFSHQLDFNGASYGGTIIASNRPGQPSIAALTGGVYKFGSPIIVNRALRIVGSGAPMLNSAGPTQFAFGPNMGGVKFSYSPVDATGATLENLALVGWQNVSMTQGHGVEANCAFQLRNVQITGFGQDGVHVVSDATLDPPTSASCFVLDNVTVLGCNGDGLYTAGGDSNIGRISGCTFRSNNGWGINEQSFLGNTYLGCHIASNKVGGINAPKPGGCNAFLGCYSENDQLHNIVNPSTIIGGVLAEACLAGRNKGDARVFGSRASGLPMRGVKSVAHFNPDGSYSPPVLSNGEIGIGPIYGSTLPEVILAIKDWAEANGSWPFRLQWNPKGGFSLDWGASGQPILWLLNSRNTIANGFPFNVSDVPELAACGGIAQRMHVLGTTQGGMICDDVHHVAPTDNRPLGSRRFNNSGNTGEPEYWLMTKAGWTPKGSI